MGSWKVQPPFLLRCLFPGALWRIAGKEKRVYLTFDDGPIPEVTPKVVDLLNSYNVKATFFCVGDNIHKYPEIFNLLIENKMGLGSHTFSHMKAWKNNADIYFSDVEKARGLNPARLFRPPHGQLFPWYISRLKRNYSKVVMWDVLSLDYRADLSSDDIYNIVVNHVRSGSIIVFHDSLKAWPRLEKALPKILDYLCFSGYEMGLIEGAG